MPGTRYTERKKPIHVRAQSMLALISLAALGATLPAQQAQARTLSETAATGCSATYTVTAQWPGGFQGNLKVTNHGPAKANWSITWAAPTGQTITQGWGAEVQQSGSLVTAQNTPWNGTLSTGSTTDIGLIGSTTAALVNPTNFTLNGTLCTGPQTATPQPTPTPTSSSPSASPTTPAPTETSTPTPTASVTPQPTSTPTQTPTPTPTNALFLDVDTQAYGAWQAANGNDKTLLAKIALTPAARWIGNWVDPQISKEEMRTLTQAAHNAGQKATAVIYAIPGRDCGHYSGGGVSTSEYAGWIDTVAQGIVGNPIIILEPDALSQLGDCAGQGDRVGFLKYAAQKLTQAGAEVYIDAGHSGWNTAAVTAQRLNQVGFEYAVGFALNVSNYQTTSASQMYGDQVSALTGGKKFIIDTSRNGNGSNGEWCNPSGRALGEKPVLHSSGNLRGLLWVKLPGESDGNCNGGPSAGAWWQAGALELARNAKW